MNRVSAARFFRLLAQAQHAQKTTVTVSENRAARTARRGRRLRERYLSIPRGEMGPVRVDNPADRAIQHGEASARGLSGSCGGIHTWHSRLLAGCMSVREGIDRARCVTHRAVNVVQMRTMR